MGGVPDWFGRAAMGFPLRTPVHGSQHRSGIEATSRFDTRHSPSTIPTHSACWSLPLRTAPHSDIESACACGYGSLSTALQERIRLSTLHRVSAPQVTLTPDVFRCESPMLNKLSCNAYGKSAHTLALQSSYATFSFPTSPMLSLRSGLSAA